VIEYSEINKYGDMKDLRDQKGNLVYNASHVCMNMFSTKFLRNICNSKLNSLPFHVASKKIPCVNSKGETETPKSENGWKLEMFIFDVFDFATTAVGFEVLREEEFSPLKNPPSDPKDSPVSCRAHLSALHKKYIKRAGGILEGPEDALFEIDPLLTHSGEDLEPIAKGIKFTLPLLLKKQSN